MILPLPYGTDIVYHATPPYSTVVAYHATSAPVLTNRMMLLSLRYSHSILCYLNGTHIAYDASSTIQYALLSSYQPPTPSPLLTYAIPLPAPPPSLSPASASSYK
eukprot:2006125-Rhodomonas_salina.1